MSTTHSCLSHSPGWLALLTIMASFTIGTHPLLAQRFMETFGGGAPVGEQGNDIIEAANGDLVVAGVTLSANAAGRPLAYVVRTNGNGALLWHKVYDIMGGNCTATDIKEYPNGDLIVVGWSALPGRTISFAMRLDANGGVIWTTPITTTYPYTQVLSVVITQFGDGITTQPGDIVVGGTTAGLPSPSADGLLARIDSNGVGIWGQTYNLPNGVSDNNDVLYELDETRIISGAGTIGDIVAVGSSEDAQSASLPDVWVLRVDGNAGDPSAGSPYGSALHGTAHTDLGLSIRELRYGSNPGDLAVTGTSYGSPSSSYEIIAMQLLADPCDPSGPRAVRFIGDNGNADEWGMCVREITSPDVGTVGNVVICGYTESASFGGRDGFMLELQEGTMAPAGTFHYYGASGEDVARVFTEVVNGPTTTGYAFTGRTTSPALMPPGHVGDLWLTRTDVALGDGCYYEFMGIFNSPAFWPPQCVGTRTNNNVTMGSYRTPADPPSWKRHLVCFAPTKIALPQSSGAAMIAEHGARPNPVHSGDPLSLGYTLTSAGTTHITITDILGRVIHERTSEHAMGSVTETIDTEGWSTGTYLATVKVNGTSVTTGIVVIDR